MFEEKYYDNALKLLVEIERENPELRDKTRELESRIMTIRKQYNLKYLDLINTLFVNADLEKGLALINELDALDPHPNQVIQSTIEEARKGAEYVFNLNRFKDLMNQALALVRQKKYADALALYVTPLKDSQATSFDLQKREFLSSGYGQIVESSVTASVARIVSLAESAKDAQAEVTKTAGQILGGTGKGGSTAFDAALTTLRSVMDLESSLEKEVDAIDAAGEAIQKSSKDNRRDFYIQYITQLCNGRSDIQEGILPVVGLIWRDAASAIAEKTASDLVALFTAAESSWTAGDYVGAKASFQGVSELSVPAVKAAALLAGAIKPAAGWKLTLPQGQDLRKLLGQALAYQDLAEQSRAMVTLTGWKMDLGAMPAAAGLDEAALKDVRMTLSARRADARVLQQDWRGRADTYAAQAKIVSSLGRLSSTAGVIAERFAGYISEAQKKDVAYAVRLAMMGSQNFTSRLAAVDDTRARAEDEMEGTVSGVLPATPVKYPSKALAALENARDSLLALESDLAKWSEGWKADATNTAGDGSMKELIAATEELEKKIQQEKTLVSMLSKKAADQHAKAAEFAKLGNQSYDRAVAMAKTDPEGADDLLTQAVDAYGSSLTFEEDDAIRRRINVDITKLQGQVAAMRNTKDITEVERLIAEGIRSINSGDYLTANQKLTQADERWKERHPGETYSPDLAYYLELSRNAIKVTGSREIFSTDPNYKVVSSYINLANQNYLEAEKLTSKGDKKGAEPYLSDAGHNIGAVLQLYPAYRIARILELKILRLTDEKGFPEKLQSLLRTYYADSNTENASALRNAYLGLKDIQEFLPNDRTIASKIVELEIKLGIRPKPIPAGDLAASTAYYNQAVAMYRKNQSETYTPTLALLNNSLEKNPNNEKARTMRSEILLKTEPVKSGAPTQEVLNSYLKARDLFNSGSVVAAKQMVDELWKNPKAKSWAPLIQLYNQINRALGT